MLHEEMGFQFAVEYPDWQTHSPQAFNTLLHKHAFLIIVASLVKCTHFFLRNTQDWKPSFQGIYFLSVCPYTFGPAVVLSVDEMCV